MGGYVFTNVLGTFYFDKEYNLVESGSEKSILKDHASALVVNENNIYKHSEILNEFNKTEYFSSFYEKGIEVARENLIKAANDDNFIIQVSKSILEIDKSRSMLVKRLGEWVGLFNPDMEKSEDSFVFEIQVGSWQDQKPLKYLSTHINSLSKLRSDLFAYLETLMKRHCPNLTSLVGVIYGSRLISGAGSLESLSKMGPARIQLLGAEKEFFSGKKQVIGILLSHPFVEKTSNPLKASKIVSEKISICVKVDFFKGDFVGDKTKSELIKKLEGI